jgi:hypothetical protein
MQFQIYTISNHDFMLYNSFHLHPHFLIIINLNKSIMSSPNTTTSNNAKKQKLVIIPPKQLFIDLTNEDNTTLSPPPQCSSPSAPNAPSKTPSTLTYHLHLFHTIIIIHQ